MSNLEALLSHVNTMTAKLRNEYPALAEPSAQIAGMIQQMIGEDKAVEPTEVDKPVAEPTEVDKSVQIEPTAKKTEVKPDRK